MRGVRPIWIDSTTELADANKGALRIHAPPYPRTPFARAVPFFFMQFSRNRRRCALYTARYRNNSRYRLRLCLSSAQDPPASRHLFITPVRIYTHAGNFLRATHARAFYALRSLVRAHPYFSPPAPHPFASGSVREFSSNARRYTHPPVSTHTRGRNFVCLYRDANANARGGADGYLCRLRVASATCELQKLSQQASCLPKIVPASAKSHPVDT